MSRSVGFACYMRVRTKAAKRDEFVRLVLELQGNVRAHEPDTLYYDFLAGADANEFVFFSGFTDQSAQQRHQAASYHMAMSKAGWDCLDGQPIIEFLTPAR